MTDLPQEEPTIPTEVESPRRQTFTIGCLVIGLAALVGIVVFITPYLNTLVAIVLPPAPPLPPAALTEIRHDSFDYGVDEWEYVTSLPACDLLTFYQSVGTCAVAPFECTSQGQLDTSDGLVARCAGTQSIGQFGMLWDVRINREDSAPQNGRIRIYRAINWLSSTPPPNP